ncbi:MAG: hypothetical protein IPI67_04835 [Myxococcales bacterium]|nr:hypothetical protein [Myxococcales bacterium]
MATTAAIAHLGHDTGGGERSITLDLERETPRLRYALGLRAEALVAEATRADTNHDGQVSKDEEAHHLDALSAELCRSLELCTGPSHESVHCRPAEPRWIERASMSDWTTTDGVGRLEWSLALPAGDANSIRLVDRWARSDVVRTDVVIMPSATRPPRAAGPDPGSRAVTLSFAFDDALLAGAPRTVAVELPPRAGKLPVQLLIVAGALLTALVVAATVRRRRRRN